MRIRAIGLNRTSVATRKPDRVRSEAIERGKPENYDENGKFLGFEEASRRYQGMNDAAFDALVDACLDNLAGIRQELNKRRHPRLT